MRADENQGSNTAEIVPARESLPARSGFLPGISGGATMALILVILSFATTRQPLALIDTISATLFRARAPGVFTSVAAIVLHFALSGTLGMLFAKVVGRTTMRATLAFGLLYGLVIWAAVQFVLLPLVHPEAAARLHIMWPFFLGHMGYGLMLAACLPAFMDIDAPVLIASARLPQELALQALTQSSDAVRDAVESVMGETSSPPPGTATGKV